VFYDHIIVLKHIQCCLSLQAKTLGSGFQRTLPLVHPVMLFRFAAVKGCSLPGLLTLFVCKLSHRTSVFFHSA